jgi:hypothetical protein
LALNHRISLAFGIDVFRGVQEFVFRNNILAVSEILLGRLVVPELGVGNLVYGQILTGD